MTTRRQALVVLLSAWPAPALGDPAGAPPERDRSVAENYQRAVPGGDRIVAGATIGINATMAAVEEILLAFHRYKEILPRVTQSRVIAKNERAGTTDVYLRAPIMHGLAYIGGTMRFDPVRPWRKRGIQLHAILPKGGVMKNWYGTWKAFPCGEKRTLLKCEVYGEFDLPLPVPMSLVNGELLWACRQGVTAVRDMVECGTSGVAND